MTLYDEIRSIEQRLVKLVAHFNAGEEWDPALRTQTALVQVNAIFGTEFDSEATYPPPEEEP